MSDPFIGEIRVFGFDFAPYQWAFCAGQSVPIQQNSALFSILGTQFGGDGVSNFMLPNLQSKAAMGSGTGPGLTARQIGQTMGTATETLTPAQMAPHTHALNASGADAPQTTVGNNLLAQGVQGTPPRTSAQATYAAAAPTSPMAPAALAPVGAGQAHNNLQPIVAMNFCIALIGVYPPKG